MLKMTCRKSLDVYVLECTKIKGELLKSVVSPREGNCMQELLHMCFQNRSCMAGSSLGFGTDLIFCPHVAYTSAKHLEMLLSVFSFLHIFYIYTQISNLTLFETKLWAIRG